MSPLDPRRLYRTLLRIHGLQGWWPINGIYKHRARLTRAQQFEIMAGALLTQNTAWTNVEKALRALRQADALCPERIVRMPSARLAKLIRPSGYFRQKTKKLKVVARWVHERSFASLRMTETDALRHELLALWGIGPETADSILLYAFDRPVFIVDAYTLRLCRAHGRQFSSYDACQRFFESRLPRNARHFKEFHALIIAQAKKQYAHRRPSPRS